MDRGEAEPHRVITRRSVAGGRTAGNDRSVTMSPYDAAKGLVLLALAGGVILALTVCVLGASISLVQKLSRKARSD
jgi:thiol:disulfide interchange protein